MISAILFVSFFVFLIMGIPISICLGLSSICAILYSGTSLTIVATNMYSGISKFLLLAIPFFVLSGNIMAKAGISKRLIKFVNTCVGHRRGGIAIVCVIVACFFGAISGSGPATVAALGSVLIPAMIEQGLIQEIDGASLENFGNLSASSVGMEFDPENQYSVPYMATITLLAVNKAKCQELNVEINGLDDLLNPALENNLVVPDDCREVVDAALKAIGEDPDSTDEATVEKASDWLSKLAPNVKLYDSDKNEINREPSVIDWDISAAEKGGYDHFMMKEIME